MARRCTAAHCATSRPRAPDSGAHDDADSDANPSGTCGAHDDTGSDANATATCGAHDDAAAHGANNASGKCAHGKCAMGPMAPMGLQPPMPMAPAMGVSPPWRAHAAAKPAGNGTATRPIEVPDDESKNPKNGKGASANPTLGLRLCKVCNEKAYSARGVCMNTGCVTWPNAINDLSIFLVAP